MDEKERQENLALLRELERQLREIDKKLLRHPPHGDDEEFEFLRKKAINYRDMIQTLRSKLYEN
jgi:hypothetical protein